MYVHFELTFFSLFLSTFERMCVIEHAEKNLFRGAPEMWKKRWGPDVEPPGQPRVCLIPTRTQNIHRRTKFKKPKQSRKSAKFFKKAYHHIRIVSVSRHTRTIHCHCVTESAKFQETN